MQAIGNGELFEQHQRLIEVRKQLADHDHVSCLGHTGCLVYGDSGKTWRSRCRQRAGHGGGRGSGV